MSIEPIPLAWLPAKDTRFGNSGTEYGFIGKWHVFGVHWGSNRAAPWTLTCRLPGIKDRIADFASKEEAKVRAASVMAHWWTKAQQPELTPKEPV